LSGSPFPVFSEPVSGSFDEVGSCTTGVAFGSSSFSGFSSSAEAAFLASSSGNVVFDTASFGASGSSTGFLTSTFSP
jgi:hypothetical protein